jgi:hypothetical protein
MKHFLRLKKNKYLPDLMNIINSVKLNGIDPKCHSIIISHPNKTYIELFINFSLEQNSKNPPTNASLNILGFKTSSNKEFVFKIKPFYCLEIFKNAQKIKIDGSYKSLGFVMNLSDITEESLIESIQILNDYDGESLTKKDCIAIATLTITTSEAIRFLSVANGINNVLQNGGAFSPNTFEIIGWGGHSIVN